MAHKKARKNQPQDDNLVDVTFSFKAKVSPKVQDLISTTTEAGKTVVKVGKRLIPILMLVSAIATSCAPKPHDAAPAPTPQIESAKQK